MVMERVWRKLILKKPPPSKSLKRVIPGSGSVVHYSVVLFASGGASESLEALAQSPSK